MLLFLGLNNILNFYLINPKSDLKKKEKKEIPNSIIKQANLVKEKKNYKASKGLGGRVVFIFETRALSLSLSLSLSLKVTIYIAKLRLVSLQSQ